MLIRQILRGQVLRFRNSRKPDGQGPDKWKRVCGPIRNPGIVPPVFETGESFCPVRLFNRDSIRRLPPMADGPYLFFSGLCS